MLARVQSALLQGIDALGCEVEVDLDEVGLEKQTVSAPCFSSGSSSGDGRGCNGFAGSVVKWAF